MTRRAWCTLLLAAALAGCATPSRTSLPKAADDCGPDQSAPVFRLSPASLGKDLAVQQQLAVTTRGQTQRVDVLLEVDATAVRLAVVAMGQTAARLEWDGRKLSETRASWLPAAVSGERILSDLQLALWPEAAVRAALPPGWFLDTVAGGRVLRQATETVVAVTYPSASRIEIDQRRDQYHLVVDTRGLP
ncbi:MAG: DUF3261 domain-containing protein [Rhizobacter sp.]